MELAKTNMFQNSLMNPDYPGFNKVETDKLGTQEDGHII